MLCQETIYLRNVQGVARIFQREGGGGGGLTVSHPGYLYGPLQTFGPENGVCNYLALLFSTRKDL